MDGPSSPDAGRSAGWLYGDDGAVLQRAADIFGLSPVALSVLAALKTLGADVDQLEARAWAAAGLTAPQGWILTQLVVVGPCPQHHLAARLMVTPSSVSQVAGRLERQGLIARRATGDRRVRSLVATEAAHARVEAVVPRLREVLAAVESALGDRALTHLGEQLARLRDALNQVAFDRGPVNTGAS